MTPEQITALFTAAAVLLAAIGALAVQLSTIAKRTKSIEKATNGAVEASTAVRVSLEGQVKALEERLVFVLEEKLEAAEAARQAASDVQAAMGRESAP